MANDKFIEEYRSVLSGLHNDIPQSKKIRALMPILEKNIKNGIPRKNILEDLAKAGLKISPTNFRIYIYRWRKRLSANQSQAVTKQPVFNTQTPVTKQSKPDFKTSTNFVKGRPGRIETPADLRKIRDMEIDLDALRLEAEALKKIKDSK